jgi:hypothetical protein
VLIVGAKIFDDFYEIKSFRVINKLSYLKELG